MYLGKKIEGIERKPAPEGSINMYYGRIGSGKTYSATADIFELLKRGEVVYATWPIKVDDFFDQRDSFLYSLFNLILGRKYYYRIFCKDNFHYINPLSFETREKYIEYLSSLNHCHLFVDEAWDIFDSYEKTNFSKTKRGFILTTRHQFRTINIIAQRPTSIQVSARSMCNRFYKCEKKSFFGFFNIFYRYEYQDMINENVNEAVDPVSTKIYLLDKKIINSYNSFYYGDLKPVDDLKFEVYILKWYHRVVNVFLIPAKKFLLLKAKTFLRGVVGGVKPAYDNKELTKEGHQRPSDLGKRSAQYASGSGTLF